MNSVRRETIRKFAEENGVVTIGQLSRILPGLSLMTIHRDLSYLQEQGLIVKIRGGARYIAADVSEPAFSARVILNKSDKKKLSEKALRFLGDSGSIFIDAGTTMMELARIIPDVQAGIVTTGPNIALELAKKSRLTVSLCGGVLNKQNLTLSGAAAMDALSRVNIDTAFIAASGFSVESGFTCGMESEARIKTLVAEKSRTSVLLMDSSKLGKMLPYTFGRLSDYNYLVTELPPEELPADLREAARESGIGLI